MIWGWGLLIILALVIWNYWIWDRFEEYNLSKICQEEIKMILKSPSTAHFSNLRKIGNNIVTYDVDAQNSFWALIRGTYLCNLDTVSWEKKIFSVDWLDDIESIDEKSVKLCVTKATLGTDFSDCLFEGQRAKLREKTCNEARELNEQGLLSWEHVDNICSSLWF